MVQLFSLSALKFLSQLLIFRETSTLPLLLFCPSQHCISRLPSPKLTTSSFHRCYEDNFGKYIYYVRLQLP